MLEFPDSILVKPELFPVRQKCLPHVPQIRQNYCGQNKVRYAVPEHHTLKFDHEHFPEALILQPAAEAELLPKIALRLPLPLLNLKIVAVSF